jgi:hypothetical protein
MRGDPRTVSLRSPVIAPSRRWSFRRAARGRHRSKAERAELFAQLASEERRRVSSGEYVPDLKMLWRWR